MLPLPLAGNLLISLLLFIVIVLFGFFGCFLCVFELLAWLFFALSDSYCYILLMVSHDFDEPTCVK